MTESILVDFGGNITWTDVVERLAEDVAVIQFEQPGVGLVRDGAIAQGDVHPETGEPIWTWNGDFEPISE